MAQIQSIPAGTHAQGMGGRNFLPDFCNVRMVFLIVIIAELVAFLFTLVSHRRLDDVLGQLSLISLFIQLLALSSAALLCLSRRLLGALDDIQAASASYTMILLVTLGFSELVYLGGRGTGLEAVLPETRHLDFLIRNLMISAIISALVLRYFFVQHQWKRQVEAESHARFQALQSRIRPHFMFNSMNTIASLTRTQPALAEEVVEDLADLFRVSLADAQHLSTLAAELEFAGRYLKIEQLRLGDRLHVEWDLAELRDDPVMPALMVQPLVENAVYHGIEPLPEGGTVRIQTRERDDLVELTITNPISPEGGGSRRRSNQLAIDNIRERLALHYGRRGRLFPEDQGDRFQIRLVFPRERGRP